MTHEVFKTISKIEKKRFPESEKMKGHERE